MQCDMIRLTGEFLATPNARYLYSVDTYIRYDKPEDTRRAGLMFIEEAGGTWILLLLPNMDGGLST